MPALNQSTGTGHLSNVAHTTPLRIPFSFSSLTPRLQDSKAADSRVVCTETSWAPANNISGVRPISCWRIANSVSSDCEQSYSGDRVKVRRRLHRSELLCSVCRRRHVTDQQPHYTWYVIDCSQCLVRH